MGKFDFKTVEVVWHKKWKQEGLFQGTKDTVINQGKSSYVLGMFPYPSGEGLHTGHGRIFTACDVLARYKRMRGYRVLLPMGWDAFGLPAENAAIKAKTNPMKLVPQNEANFRRQMEMLGLSYDWTREFSTTDPEYYKWTQWLFLQLYSIRNKQGKRMVYREEVPINWCTQCKTGLANEEVLADGTHERCGKSVTKKLLPQWVMRITDYADELLEELDSTEWMDPSAGSGQVQKRVGLDWPKGILEMQRNWIGKKEGINVHFKIGWNGSDQVIKTFTTRIDTIFGVTFVVVAPELIDGWIKDGWNPQEDVVQYVENALGKTEQQRLEGEKDKTGVDTGLKVVNPANGEEVPVWVADYVLPDVGTGVVMGVPAHDGRDFEFAEKHRLPICRVVKPIGEGVFRSYLMGADGISNDELVKIGVVVVETLESGNRKLLIKEDVVAAYEKLVSQKMTPGYWNEYLGDEVVFVFKHKNGNLERLILDLDNDSRIRELMEEFTDGEIRADQPIWSVLRGNEWYREVCLYEEYGELAHSGEFDGMSSEEAMKAIPKKFADVMEKSVSYHLRDWVFSRQRYWGEPFPLVYCAECAKTQAGRTSQAGCGCGSGGCGGHKGEDKHGDGGCGGGHCSENMGCCGGRGEEMEEKLDIYEIDGVEYAVVPVPEADLPVKLPELKQYEPTDTGQSPLSRVDEWVSTKCPRCGGPAMRETDTMPNWAGSCWYFLRFAMEVESGLSMGGDGVEEAGKKDGAGSMEQVWKRSLENNPWLPVQWYLGGAEHAVLHLLYARFWVKAFNDLGLLEFREPFLRLRSVGMVLAEDGRKMSKSLGNVVNPDEVVARFGADAVRIYEMFMGPWGQAIAWETTALVGCKRFLDKVWGVYMDPEKIGKETSASMVGVVHRAIKKVGEDVEAMKFNTAVACLMELVNDWRQPGVCLSRQDAVAVVRLLAPLAPYISEELYQRLVGDGDGQGEFESVHETSWPEYSEEKTQTEKVEIPVQVNGKLRGALRLPREEVEELDEEEVLKLALAEEKVAGWVEGKEVARVVWVRGKLVNIVVR